MTIIRFDVSTMKKGMKNIHDSVKAGKGQPSSLTLTDMNGKKRTLKKKQYCGLFDNQAKYFLNNSRYPNYTTYLYDTDTPFVGKRQPNSWTCGSTSLSNASTQILYYKTEAQCRKACGTGTNGTSPSQLVAGAKKLGIKVEKINRTFTSVKAALDKGYGVIAHIQTANVPCLGYAKDYGHWITIYNYTGDYKFKVYDPSRDYKVCNANQIIKATGGRDIHFYAVKPL